MCGKEVDLDVFRFAGGGALRPNHTRRAGSLRSRLRRSPFLRRYAFMTSSTASAEEVHMKIHWMNHPISKPCASAAASHCALLG